MNTASHDFVTVDMRGLKAALVAHARNERVSTSVVVRRAVLRELKLVDPRSEVENVYRPADATGDIVKLSIRLTRSEAEQLAMGARRAGLSRGAYLAGLLNNVACLADGSSSRRDHLAGLHASCAELSTLARNLHHLATLLRQGEHLAAQSYLPMLQTLARDVKAHLDVATRSLRDLQPARNVHHDDREARPI